MPPAGTFRFLDLPDPHEAPLRQDGHEPRDADLDAFLEHPFELLPRQHALEQGHFHRRLAGSLPLVRDPPRRLPRSDRRQRHIVLGARAVEDDDGVSRPKPQDVVDLMRLLGAQPDPVALEIRRQDEESIRTHSPYLSTVGAEKNQDGRSDCRYHKRRLSVG